MANMSHTQSAGVMLDRQGWETLNWLALPCVGPAAVMIAWLRLQVRRLQHEDA